VPPTLREAAHSGKCTRGGLALGLAGQPSYSPWRTRSSMGSTCPHSGGRSCQGVIAMPIEPLAVMAVAGDIRAILPVLGLMVYCDTMLSFSLLT
jgi:hypothetical protein